MYGLLTVNIETSDGIYFFLCVVQYFDFPDTVFLHFVPFVVFAAHFTFFAFAMCSPPPFFFLKLLYHNFS
jgi:hypothetical protein